MVGLSIFVAVCNRQTQRTIKKFTSLVHLLHPTVVSNVKLRYWTTNGGKSTISLNSRCDLYLFDNCLAVTRREHFIYTFSFAPILITSNKINAERMFDYIRIYNPYSIIFREIVQGEIVIKVSDPLYTHYKIELTLMGMTKEQIAKFKRIEDWLN
ncbi:hypothetical protein CJD36_009755 [Flavipsychrobacter stenotrophus]|uniref:YokE-like PH domain-containing protein n=1 Tax=Flavipsychrobacter stenotrophus TaxID=2077091 RepID=A0A2S7SYN7_9BACT|nr:hypothetical protein CJD36_009755 [Flavipsychrobacter stenotrophus]